MPPNKTIFVAIPSYRDAELLPTVERLIAAASQPTNLRFGICQQDKLSDWVDFSQLQGKVPVKIYNCLPEESNGLCWALNKCFGLYGGEDYFLQLDAHSEMIKGWDNVLIGQDQRCFDIFGSEKNIFSSYPAAYTLDKQLNRILLPHGQALKTRLHYEYDRDFPSGHMIEMEDTDRPLKARYLSGGFMFGSGRFCTEVPYNPEIVFWGTEIVTTVRAYTAGFDLYHPNQPVGWHHYGERHIARKGRPHVWNLYDDEKRAIKFEERNRKSFDLVGQLLAGTYQGPFGVGSARSLAQFEHYAGIDFKTRVRTQEAESGDYSDC